MSDCRKRKYDDHSYDEKCFHIGNFMQCGLSFGAYALQNNLPYSNLYRWVENPPGPGRKKRLPLYVTVEKKLHDRVIIEFEKHRAVDYDDLKCRPEVKRHSSTK